MNYVDSFSGSKFELFEKNKSIYIKKFYKKINDRDLLSFEKQKNFQSYNLGEYIVQSADIKEIDKDKKFITLNYYSGLSGSELILNGDLQIHKFLNLFLKSYIKNLIDTSKYEKFHKEP